MIGLVLTITICMIDAPSKCKDILIPLAEELTPYQCMVRAQPEIAKAMEAHPNWRVVRWGCRTVKGSDA